MSLYSMAKESRKDVTAIASQQKSMKLKLTICAGYVNGNRQGSFSHLHLVAANLHRAFFYIERAHSMDAAHEAVCTDVTMQRAKSILSLIQM